MYVEKSLIYKIKDILTSIFTIQPFTIFET